MVRAMNALAGKRRSLGSNSPTISQPSAIYPSHLTHLPLQRPTIACTTSYTRYLPTHNTTYTRLYTSTCLPMWRTNIRHTYTSVHRIHTAHKPSTPTPSPSHIHAHYIEVIRLYIGRCVNVSRYSIVYHTDISTAYYRYIAIATSELLRAQHASPTSALYIVY